LVFGQHRFCDGAFWFSFPILVLYTILPIVPHLFVAGIETILQWSLQALACRGAQEQIICVDFAALPPEGGRI
jgi:hypothetical protein